MADTLRAWLAKLVRPLPWLVLLAIVLMAAWGALDASPRAGQDMPLGNGVDSGDVVLYQRIDQQVVAGHDYYPAAAALHRQMHYPLKPFFTVRTPVLSWLYAALGPIGLVALAVAVIAASALAWNWRLAQLGYGLMPRALCAALISMAGALGLDLQLICFHEVWAGLLLSLALAMPAARWFAPQLALAALALAIRELAAPFVLLMLAAALWRGEIKRALATMAVLAAFGAAYWFGHKPHVEAVTLGSDMASQGWLAMRGPVSVAYDIAFELGLGEVWRPLAIFVALAPLAGWADYGRHDGHFAFLWFAGFIAACAMFARVDNYYWVQLVLPAYVIGWVLLIDAGWRETRAASRRRTVAVGSAT